MLRTHEVLSQRVPRLFTGFSTRQKEIKRKKEQERERKGKRRGKRKRGRKRMGEKKRDRQTQLF